MMIGFCRKEDGSPARCYNITYIAGYYKAKVQVELVIHRTPRISLFIFLLGFFVTWNSYFGAKMGEGG